MLIIMYGLYVKKEKQSKSAVHEVKYIYLYIYILNKKGAAGFTGKTD